jgi:hypothetical protein
LRPSAGGQQPPACQRGHTRRGRAIARLVRSESVCVVTLDTDCHAEVTHNAQVATSRAIALDKLESFTEFDAAIQGAETRALSHSDGFPRRQPGQC